MQHSGKVASVINKGFFGQIGPLYCALAGQIAENGYEISGTPEEVYYSDPANTPAEELLTEVRFPVRKK